MANLSPSLEKRVDKVVDIPGGARNLTSSNSFAGLEGVINFVDSLFGGSRMTNQTNMTMNRENIAFQREENDIARQREDNAVQRAAADMEAAGLSKTLAAGQPASAQAMEAPSNSFAMEKSLGGLNAIKFLKEMYFDDQANKRANALNDAQIDKLNAEIDNLDSSTAGNNLSNSVYLDRYGYEVGATMASTEQSKALSRYYNAQAQISEVTGEKIGEKLNAEIDLMIAQRAESFSRFALNNAESAKTSAETQKVWKEIDKMAEEIKMEIAHTEYYNSLTEEQKEKVNLLIIDQVKAKVEANILTQNLWYGVYNGLPVGAIPNGIIGGMYNTSQAIAAGLRNEGFSMMFPYSLNIGTTSSLNNPQLPQPL